MKYVSIDIETSGIDRDRCEILSIGAVIEDTEKKNRIDQLPRFHAAIIRTDRHGFYGEPVALNMNRDLIEAIVKYNEAKTDSQKEEVMNDYDMVFYKEEEIVEKFYHWLYFHGAFDLSESYINDMNKMVTIHPVYGAVPHINRAPKAVINVAGKNFATFDKIFLEKLPRWKQLIEIRNRILDPAILFVDWKEDKALPGLDLCKQRAGIEGEVTHNAVEDAIDVVKILRKIYRNT
jgi:oligoribonuclease